MGLTLANLRAEVLVELGVDATDLDSSGSANLDLLINSSWWEVMDKFNFREKEDDCTFATVAGTRDYNLATKILAADTTVFDALKQVSILNPDSEQHVRLMEMSIGEYESQYSEDTDTRDIPTHYVRYGGSIRLFPTPDDAYTLTVYYLKVLTDVASGGPDVPQSWHEIVMYGAVWRGHHRFRDYNSANEARAVQASLIASAMTVPAKEDANKKYIGVELPHLSSGRRY
jgi:hypothetical protein